MFTGEYECVWDWAYTYVPAYTDEETGEEVEADWSYDYTYYPEYTYTCGETGEEVVLEETFTWDFEWCWHSFGEGEDDWCWTMQACWEYAGQPGDRPFWYCEETDSWGWCDELDQAFYRSPELEGESAFEPTYWYCSETDTWDWDRPYVFTGEYEFVWDWSYTYHPAHTYTCEESGEEVEVEADWSYDYTYYPEYSYTCEETGEEVVLEETFTWDFEWCWHSFGEGEDDWCWTMQACWEYCGEPGDRPFWYCAETETWGFHDSPEEIFVVDAPFEFEEAELSDDEDEFEFVEDEE